MLLIVAWVVSGWFVADVKDFGGVSYQDVSDAKQAVDMHQMLSTSLFGSTQVTQIKTPVTKESRLSVKLVGTVVADPAYAIAIFSVAGNPKQKVVHVNEALQPGVILKEIESHAVVVDNQGKLERIMLEKGKVIAGMNRAVASRSHHANVQQKRLSRAHINRQIRNFPELMKQARALPYLENGEIAGFSVNDIVPGSLYEQIGLKNGDVIRKVNGQSITNAAQAMQMYQDLQNASSIDLELGRGGAVVPIHYDIQ